jgi:hypothetical protein
MLNEDVPNSDGDSPGGFQHEPMRPVPAGDAESEIPRPKAVDHAFQASLASTAIASLATIFTLLFDQAWLDKFAHQMLTDAGRQITDQDLATALAVARFSLGFGILLFAAVFVLFALKMRAGRNWARLLLAVFAALGVMNFLTAVVNTGAALDLMWSLAEVAFAVTAVVYMFRPESTAYFLEHRKRRLARRGGPGSPGGRP